MRFYRLELVNDEGHSAGCHWFTSAREAQSHRAHWLKDNSVEHGAILEAFDITPTRQGILAALRRHASHPDNG